MLYEVITILMENLPFWTYFVRTPHRSIALMAEWEKKLEKITETTLNENVTTLTGVPSWFLVLIKHVLAKAGKNNLLEVWPNLELFIHGGINFTPYREQFKELIPSDKMNYLETYNASEGFVITSYSIHYTKLYEPVTVDERLTKPVSFAI